MRSVSRIVLAVALLWPSLGPAQDAPRPLALPEAIHLALENNPDLATAQQRVKAARAGIQQTESALWPHVSVRESYTASDNPVQAFMMTLNQRAFSLNTDFNHPDNTDNLGTKVLAQWSLYDGGQSLANRQAAKLNSEAAAQSLDAARNDLVFEVSRAYYTVNKARQFVLAANASVASMEANVNLASNRFAAGQALKTDLLDAEVRLAEARENQVRARNAEALSETIFRNVLGVGEKENVTAATTPPHPNPLPRGERKPEPSTSEMQSVIPSPHRGEGQGEGKSSRPELAAARTSVTAAEKQVRAAKGGYIPRLNAFASYDVDSGNAEQFKDSWIAGVSVDLDVFDGFLTRGKVAEARANLDASREQLRKAELAVGLEIKQAQLNVAEAQARLDTTGKSVAQAEESLQITKDRYAGGLALLTQVLDAETALTGARQRRAAAEADSLIARAALDRALGKTWKEQ